MRPRTGIDADGDSCCYRFSVPACFSLPYARIEFVTLQQNVTIKKHIR
jgi:hypothetical protein